VKLPVKANSHIPCRAPAILRHCRVLHESPRGSRKYPNCWSYGLTDWYASDNSLRGTPRGSRKKSNTGRSPTCCLWTADANSHMTWHAHAAPMPRCAVALRSRFKNGMVVAWHGRGMACVKQTRPHCVNQMGKTQSKPLAARHGICELSFIVTACYLQIECRWENKATMLRGVGKCKAAFGKWVSQWDKRTSLSAVQGAAKFSLTLVLKNTHMVSLLIKLLLIGWTLVAADCCVGELNQSASLFFLDR
jgi:hypothetical protein